MTRGSTYENAANLAPSFLERLRERYEGSRLGRQEIHAELLEDVPGALWSRATIDKYRVTQHPPLSRVVVAIDPSTTDNKTSDECGIVVEGMSADRNIYVLEDLTDRMLPAQWADKAIKAYYRNKANAIVTEGNNGGEAWRTIINMMDPDIPVQIVWASEAKQTRAEPMATKYEQGLVHHVGTHARLEDEQCTWVPLGGKSPNRIDAAVWGWFALSRPRGIDLIGL